MAGARKILPSVCVLFVGGEDDPFRRRRQQRYVCVSPLKLHPSTAATAAVFVVHANSKTSPLIIYHWPLLSHISNIPITSTRTRENEGERENLRDDDDDGCSATSPQEKTRSTVRWRRRRRRKEGKGREDCPSAIRRVRRRSSSFKQHNSNNSEFHRRCRRRNDDRRPKNSSSPPLSLWVSRRHHHPVAASEPCRRRRNFTTMRRIRHPKVKTPPIHPFTLLLLSPFSPARDLAHYLFPHT